MFEVIVDRDAMRGGGVAPHLVDGGKGAGVDGVVGKTYEDD